MLQGGINPRQRHLFPKLGEACDPVFGNAARNDATEMRQVRGDIESETVKRDPAFHAHAEGPDLGFIGAIADPDPDATIGSMRAKPKIFQRVDHPAFESMDEAADVFPALFEVEHYVADPLTRSMIGVAASATRLVDRKILRVGQFGRVCARSGGKQGRVLQKPDALGCSAFPYGGGALIHEGERFLISDGRVANPPFNVAKRFLHGGSDGEPVQIEQVAPKSRGQHNEADLRERGKMRALSISAAWEETKAILARDGQLLVTVALALVAFPTAVNALVNPDRMNNASTPWWVDLISVLASLIALAGQLALIRLAIGPSITVGGAIAHGLRRMPIYFLSVLMVVVGLIIVALPLVLLLSALGVPVDAKGVPPSPTTIVVGLFYLAIILFFGVRLLLSSPVASAEDQGPIGILVRSWHLTSGHWWPLFGFLLLIIVSAIVLLLAIGSAVGLAVVWQYVGSRGTLARWSLVGAIALLTAYSLAANFGMSITPTGWWSSEQAAAYVRAQDRVGGVLGSPASDNVVYRNSLPTSGPVGQIMIVGRCDRVYFAASTGLKTWIPIGAFSFHGGLTCRSLGAHSP